LIPGIKLRCKVYSHILKIQNRNKYTIQIWALEWLDFSMIRQKPPF
jgi:hypothetical protein